MTPTPGLNPEYDEAMAEIKNVENLLQDYLKEQRKVIGAVSILLNS